MGKRWLFSSTKLKNTLLVLALVGVTAASAHLWIAERLAVLRAIYPIEAQIAQLNTSCSPNAPRWMEAIIDSGVKYSGGLVNQVAYISPQGQLFHCENGWQQALLFSPFVTAKSRFRYGSVTKVFTADSILGLINGGRLTLDTRLADIFSDLPTPKDPRLQKISIGMLLNHTAGFDRLKSEDPLFKYNHKPWCPYEPEKLAELKLDFPPGERHAYSNVGYCILGMIIEKVTGQAFREHLAERYDFSSNGMAFVNGPYMMDEVRYDFRNVDFYIPSYYRFLDFHALSSSAGISGNASALAFTIQSMLANEPFNIVSGDIPEDCDLSEFRSCFGLATYVYQEEGKSLRIYLHEGYLPAASSVVVVDAFGGVTVLLSGGAALGGPEQKEKIYRKIYSSLQKHYEGAEVITAEPSLPK